MMYVRPVTAEEHAELKRMTRQAIGRVSQRAQMILASAQHRSVPDIATLVDVSRATVRFWIRRFDAAGPPGLYDDPRSGRPPKVTAAVERALVAALQQDPQRLNAAYLATFWTVAMLALTLATQLHVPLSAGSIRATLHRLGLRWRRPRLAMPDKTDPLKAAKQWAIAAAVVGAAPEDAILYADESRVQTLPLVRALWQWIGAQVRIPTPGSNTCRALFGALNLRTGQWQYQTHKRMQAVEFIAFLEYLLTVYPSHAIILIVDNYSSHTAKSVAAWVVAHPRVQLHFLPKYCSHLNPVERIWLQLKNHIAANRLYGTLKLLLQTVDSFFATMTPDRALAWAAVGK